MKSIFSIPKVVKYDDLSKSWFVYFRYDKKLFRYKCGINLFNTYKKRESEANALRDALHQKLREGWNPNIPDLYEHGSISLNDALDFALKKKKDIVSPATFKSYSIAVKFFKTATDKLRLGEMQLADVKRIHIKSIFEKIKTTRGWSNKAYNKNLGFIKAIFSEMQQWDILENNPSHKIKSLPVGEVLANVPATDDQVVKIKEKLTSEFPNFYNFIVTIFHTGIRPAELLRVKIGMIDMVKREIHLPPEITKTDIYRIVPINDHLFNIFSTIGAAEKSKDLYIFGSTRQHFNRGLRPDTDFVPGPNTLKSDTTTKLWRKLIKTDLGMDVNQYSMKHLGADKKILAGIDLDSLRELYGHTSKRMTLRYAKVVKEVYRKQIIEHSPDF